MQYVYNSCLFNSAAAALTEAIYDYFTALGNNSPAQALAEMEDLKAAYVEFEFYWTLQFDYSREMFDAAAEAVKVELQSR